MHSPLITAPYYLLASSPTSPVQKAADLDNFLYLVEASLRVDDLGQLSAHYFGLNVTYQPLNEQEGSRRAALEAERDHRAAQQATAITAYLRSRGHGTGLEVLTTHGTVYVQHYGMWNTVTPSQRNTALTAYYRDLISAGATVTYDTGVELRVQHFPEEVAPGAA